MPSTEFSLTGNTRTVGKCRTCQQIDNEARTRQESSQYRRMLRTLRRSEDAYQDGSHIAFLLQVFQLTCWIVFVLVLLPCRWSPLKLDIFKVIVNALKYSLYSIARNSNLATDHFWPCTWACLSITLPSLFSYQTRTCMHIHLYACMMHAHIHTH